MRTKCHSCLCRTCVKVCGKCTDCKEKTELCENYTGFQQMSIFDAQPPQSRSAPRHSWEYYGLTDERVEELKRMIQSGVCEDLALQIANKANKDIAECLLLSVTQNKSYDALRVKWELKEMEQIPYCRTDFYGIRRYFYHLLDLEIRRMEECI